MNRLEKKLYRRVSLLSAGLIFGSVPLILAFCDYSNLEICNKPDFEIIVGTVIGVITTALFFLLIERHQQKLENKVDNLLKGTYSIRTDMYNLLDVFAGKAHKIQPTEKNRMIFVKQLEEHIKAFELENDKDVLPIWEKAHKHVGKISDMTHDRNSCQTCKEINENQRRHFETIFSHQANCNHCKEIVGLIHSYLKKKINPLQIDEG
jgi:hypothetical protein